MCGIIGVHRHPEASGLVYLGLYAQQHRGQESAGIASCDGKSMFQHREMGLVSDIFNEKVLKSLKGHNAIGHVRYSTSGDSVLENSQPFSVMSRGEFLAVAHNGNITNALELKDELESHGAIFQTSMDSEVIMHLIARDKAKDIEDRIANALSKVEGAYSLVFLFRGKLIAVRDPRGFRPLCIGKVNGAYVVASESCALDLLDAKYIRSVDAGEMIVFKDGEMNSYPERIEGSGSKRAQCIFEYIYFARPDSHIFGRDVYSIRTGFGRQLAREYPTKADVVIPVPDSGVPAAIGYSHESGIPYDMGLIRNHYIGRTFIEPRGDIRHFGVKIKLNTVREIVDGKDVVVIDDSIVRGTTSMKIVKMLRHAGARKIHMRISSPPTCWPCFYGIDTPTRAELIASSKSTDEIKRFITADSLEYLSKDGLYWFEKKGEREWFCDACFTGKYPTDVTS